MATVDFDRQPRRNPWTDEDVPARGQQVTPNQSPWTGAPVATQPYTPAPWTGAPVGTAPYTPAAPQSMNAAGRGVSPEQFYRDYLARVSPNLRQSQPGGWNELVQAMNAEGYQTTLDTRTDGLHKGIMLNGQFVKLADGYDNPIWMPGGNEPSGGEGAPGAGAGYTDPSSELFINELLSRMETLRKPVEDPLAPLYQLMSLMRVQNLQGQPYTAGEDAALTSRYMTPLTQARDAELQQNKERIGARGMLPSSGLLDELNKTTNQNYQGGVAQYSNDLAVRAVDEKQQRQEEQLNVLLDLLQQGRTSRTEEDRRGQELIELAAMFPAMDERRLNSLLSASGDNSAAQAQSGLLQQQSNATLERYRQAQTDAERDAALGAFFAALPSLLDEIF